MRLFIVGLLVGCVGTVAFVYGLALLFMSTSEDDLAQLARER